MIPDLITLDSSPWKVLPEGIHSATLAEIAIYFGTTPHRRVQFLGLEAAAKNLANAGCQYLYLDGSYVTGKPTPGDYDGCWDPSGVNPTLLDPVFLDFTNQRKNQKSKYQGELFPFSLAAPGVMYLDFFQTDRFTGLRKGILVIDLKKEFCMVNEGVQP